MTPSRGPLPGVLPCTRPPVRTGLARPPSGIGIERDDALRRPVFKRVEHAVRQRRLFRRRLVSPRPLPSDLAHPLPPCHQHVQVRLQDRLGHRPDEGRFHLSPSGHQRHVGDGVHPEPLDERPGRPLVSVDHDEVDPVLVLPFDPAEGRRGLAAVGAPGRPEVHHGGAAVAADDGEGGGLRLHFHQELDGGHRVQDLLAVAAHGEEDGSRGEDGVATFLGGQRRHGRLADGDASLPLVLAFHREAQALQQELLFRQSALVQRTLVRGGGVLFRLRELQHLGLGLRVDRLAVFGGGAGGGTPTPTSSVGGGEGRPHKRGGEEVEGRDDGDGGEGDMEGAEESRCCDDGRLGKYLEHGTTAPRTEAEGRRESV
mmetsp:Transcript_35803/g.83405  ORF Transcript_35803/g.83405 Transcript_35803/m.83405 type:complete len:371 (+) Transcript_35803:346-1458(+)